MMVLGALLGLPREYLGWLLLAGIVLYAIHCFLKVKLYRLWYLITYDPPE
jgi:hypothetical protein